MHAGATTMYPEAIPAETKFDLMADLCILAGQAVMQVGSNDLQAAMRVVLGILGREVAARSLKSDDRPAERSVSRAAKPGSRRRAAPDRLPSCV